MGKEAITLVEPALADVEWPPTEDELPRDDGVPMDTQRHVLQLDLLMYPLLLLWVVKAQQRLTESQQRATELEDRLARYRERFGELSERANGLIGSGFLAWFTKSHKYLYIFLSVFDSRMRGLILQNPRPGRFWPYWVRNSPPKKCKGV